MWDNIFGKAKKIGKSSIEVLMLRVCCVRRFFEKTNHHASTKIVLSLLVLEMLVKYKKDEETVGQIFTFQKKYQNNKNVFLSFTLSS